MQKHDLHSEFPEFDAKIHEMKTSDSHFKNLFDEYEKTNKQIHHYESGAQATTDEHLTDLRKQRLHLKDSLYELLQD